MSTLGKVYLLMLCGLISAKSLDLTHGFDNNTWYWPSGQIGFTFEILTRGLTDKGYWYEGNQFSSGEHGGTHMDSPNHFAEGALSVDEVAIENFFCPAVVIDIRDKVAGDPDVNLTLSDVTQWESEHGEIPEKAVVFQCSGWSEKYGVDKAGFFGNDQDDSSDFHFPGFSAEAASWLVDNRKIAAVAVETPSIDYGPSSTYPAHVALMTRNVYALENVKDPCSLPPRGATVYVMPMKIVDGSGAPVRVVATWDDDVINASNRHTFAADHIVLSLLLCSGLQLLNRYVA